MRAAPFIVALIATCDRPKLLAGRALPSVAAQRRRPDLLIVADDSDGKHCAANDKAVNDFRADTGIPVLYARNKRCKGASGAWNTGALAALRLSKCADKTYLAILDDDDEWFESHLAEAETRIFQTRADVVAAAFERREKGGVEIVAPPRTPHWRDFLTGNPGIQGSNLVVRLSAFMKAGMFDEGLQACTDRDLCLRLFLSRASYAATKTTTVAHYANADIARLSNRADPRRLSGLSAFARKYRGWMSDAEWRRFCRRAKTLFGWRAHTEEKTKSAAAIKLTAAANKEDAGRAPLVLVVGVIVDIKRGAPNGLFDDLLALSRDARAASLDVVVMPAGGYGSEFAAFINRWRKAGLRLYVVPAARASKLLSHVGARYDKRGARPIAINRTLLHYHAGRLARYIAPQTAVWILDDDVRLHALDENGKQRKPDYAGEIMRLRDSGCDIAVGGVDGAASLPRAATVRVQLADMLHCLASETSGYKHSPRGFPSLREMTARNYHHDYLPHHFVEMPAGAALLRSRFSRINKNIPAMTAKLLVGGDLSRPVVSGNGGVPYRGGNTLVFNSAALLDYPNGFASPALCELRRADEVWRICNEHFGGRSIATGDFAVCQQRGGDNAQSEQAPDCARLARDICGHAVAGAFDAFAKQNSAKEGGLALPAFDDGAFAGEVRRRAAERMAAVDASFFRIEGLADSMLHFPGTDAATVNALTNIKHKFARHAVNKTNRAVETLLTECLAPGVWRTCAQCCKHYAQLKKRDGDDWKKWRISQRRDNALALVNRLCAPAAAPRYLGGGHEGSVFVTAGEVVKVLHHWHILPLKQGADFLPSLAGKTGRHGRFYPLLEWRRDGADAVLTLPWEKTAPYNGGCGASMVAMLAGMRERGFLHWNLAPYNLRRRGDEVMAIDYGADMHPFTLADFVQVARKAWLCCFWHFRGDLEKLLTASLSRADLPELAGWRKMLVAASQYGRRARCGDGALDIVLAAKPRRALDYGCGKGKNVKTMLARGIATAAFDVVLPENIREDLSASGAAVFDNQKALLASAPYDAILFRHVLCEIRGKAALRKTLANLRRLTADNGVVAASFCDPNGIARETQFAKNILPLNPDFGKCFFYRKHLRKSGGTRRHYHRPEHAIMREIARAGFRVVRRESKAEIDINRFEKCAGSMTLQLSPLPLAPQTALVIRACAMEAKTLAAQVCHLVRQLNYPRGFCEVILALDCREENFLREHCGGNLKQLRAVAERLKTGGWIDAIVEPVGDKATLRRLNKKWGGVDSAQTHTKNNVPTAVVWAAFEKCRAPFAMHVDADMIVGRKYPAHDYLGEMLAVIKKREATTMSLDIAGDAKPACGGGGAPYRLEVRAGLTDLKRLRKLLPLPCGNKDGDLELSWHRAADIAIRGARATSLRHGDQRLFVVHPPNARKTNREALFNVMDAVERMGQYPQAQAGKTDWDGDDGDWVRAERNEPFVFVVCGRNVSRGRVDRCLDSLFAQKNREWGAVVIDDNSEAHIADYARRKCTQSPRPGQVSFFARRSRAGGMANLVFAVRRVCGNSDTVIVTLDMDDMLIGDDVVCELSRRYEAGADMTVGSMLRTDKEARYRADFNKPRQNRGGNVWQHLRSFKKHLFDALPDDDLRLDGEYADIGYDWAYMLPMAEAAKKPVWIKRPLYLHDPGEKRTAAYKEAREKNIARILGKRRIGERR